MKNRQTFVGRTTPFAVHVVRCSLKPARSSDKLNTLDMCTIRIAPHLSCTVQWQQAIRLPVMTVSTSRAAGTLLPARVDEGVVAAAGYSNPQTTNRSFNRRGEQLRRPVLGLAARGLTTFSYHCSKSNSCVVERAAAGSAGGAAVGISSNTRMNKSLPPLTAVLGRLLSTSTCNFRCFIARAAGGNNTEVLVSGRMQMGGDSRRALASMSEAEFHDTADETLESIHDAVEGALEDGFDGEFDCNMSVSQPNEV